MNLPTSGWIAGRGHRTSPGLAWFRRRVAAVRAEMASRPAAVVVAAGALIVLTSAFLEAVDFRNGWLLFEDVSATVAPMAATIGVCLAMRRDAEHKPMRRALALSLGLVSAGQIAATIPDAIHAFAGPLATFSDAVYVIGAFLGTTTMLGSLYGRLQSADRLTVPLNGAIIIAAAMTAVVANWLFQTFGTQTAAYFESLSANLIVPLMSAMFFSSAAAAAVAALALRVQPSRGSVWAVTLGVVLMAIAWEGWLGRFISGVPDGIEPMDFIFPAGALATGWGGVTWDLRPASGARYERFAQRMSDWTPAFAIAGCAFLDVMPRSRPLLVDPVAVGTCTVVCLAVVRQAVLQGRERESRERLTREMGERAATAVMLANLESGATVEESAKRISAEALRIDGIDTVTVFGFTPSGVVPLAHAGPQSRPGEVGKPLPDDAALVMEEHATFGLWLENWSSKTDPTEFEQGIIDSGLRAEAMAPLLSNDELVGVLAFGATTPEHASRLADRLATLTEFAVMSAAMLGPALSDRAQRETTIAEVQAVIATRAFTPVFQAIVDLDCRAFVGYESLTRFADGTRPDVRFLAADKVGMMVELERACLREQVVQARKLPQGSFLTLNVSPALAIEPEFLIDLLRTADRPVVLEITEHVEIEDYPRLMAALDRVRPMAMLAVDDAGAGYAGLRHILELRPQYVKLDISLVRNIDTDPARQAMVTGMASFAQGVGCSLIAEGIETPEELATLRMLHIPFGQGYYLAKPASVQ